MWNEFGLKCYVSYLDRKRFYDKVDVVETKSE